MHLQFQYQHYAWLLTGVIFFIILFVFILQWKRKVTRRIGDEKLVNALVKEYSSRKFFLKFFLLVFCFVLGVAAVMNLRKPGGESPTERKGIDLAIALDVSKSMLATDLAPSRIERAKHFINRLIATMPNDRIALIVFAGNAYLQMPLTIDHGAATLFVSAAAPGNIPNQGTNISEALTRSAAAFGNTDDKFKSIVLITDGEDHHPEAIATAKKLAAEGVMINTIGIGSTNGASFMDPATGMEKRDDAGNIVITKLNDDELRSIAEKTNGIYLKLDNSEEAIAQLKTQLSQIKKKAFNDQSLLNFTSYYFWFAGAMFLGLLWEGLISEKKKIKKIS